LGIGAFHRYSASSVPKTLSDCGKARTADSIGAASRTWSGLFGWDFGEFMNIGWPVLLIE
jgi:hypothetical protein